MAIIGNMKVVVKTAYNYNNPFYGNRKHINVIEETFIFEHDKREADEIAPSGIHATLKTEKSEFDITLTRRILENRIERTFAWDFTINNGECYEITITFDADGKIESVILEEWESSSAFCDDCDPIASYNITDFEPIEY